MIPILCLNAFIIQSFDTNIVKCTDTIRVSCIHYNKKHIASLIVIWFNNDNDVLYPVLGFSIYGISIIQSESKV